MAVNDVALAASAASTSGPSDGAEAGVLQHVSVSSSSTAPAPLAALPPAPKTKPVVVTPAMPYRIDDVIEAETRQMEDMGREMSEEIRRRSR